jgi:hypothetical protein
VGQRIVAHLAAERTRLHEPQVMRIGVFSPTHKTRLLGNEPQMFLVATAFVDTGRYPEPRARRARVGQPQMLWLSLVSPTGEAITDVQEKAVDGHTLAFLQLQSRVATY